MKLIFNMCSDQCIKSSINLCWIASSYGIAVVACLTCKTEGADSNPVRGQFITICKRKFACLNKFLSVNVEF